VTGVQGRKSQDVAEESAVGLRVLAAGDNKNAVNLEGSLPSLNNAGDWGG